MSIFRQDEKSDRNKSVPVDQSDPRGPGEEILGRRKLPRMPGTIPDGGARDLPRMPGTVPDGNAPRKSAKLSELKPGESGIIEKLHGNAQGRLRLMEMGMTPGVHVKVLHAAAFGGPLQISVRGYQLSLRREEASGVFLG
jgi:ferrous iron transport protein A